MEGTSDTLLVTAARDRDHAADIAQDAFVRVFEALPRLTGELNFSAYVYRTTHNIAIDAVKGRSRFDSPDMLDVQAEPGLRADPERMALVQEQQHQAWQAAFKLSDDHRAILTLRELHDLSYQEIAEIMDMPRNTVGVLLSRARLRFKEAFRMSSIDIDKLTAECRDMLPLLSAYIDDELDDKKRVRVESHLEDCAFCRLALEEMTESSRSYRAILPLLPPAALGEGLRGRLGDLTMSSEPASSQSASFEAASSDTATSSGPTDGAGAGVDGHAGMPGDTRGPSQAPAPKAISKPRSWPIRLRPRLLALFAGGAIMVALVTLGATGTFGGRGGSDGDVATAGDMVDGGVAGSVVATTTASLESGATLTTSSAVSTEAPTTVSSLSDTSTVPATSVGATATDGGSAPDAGTLPVTTNPPSTTTTEAKDTTAPPTPAIIYPALGDTVQGTKITLRWEPVKDASGVTYRVEVESLDRKVGAYVLSQVADGIKGTQLTHVAVSDVERWRVTAVDGAGNSGNPSSWAKYANPSYAAPSTTTTTLILIIPPLVTVSTTTTVMLY